jgi:hypothetical protein
MTLMAAVVELATGAAVRALAVSVATSFAQAAVLAFLAHACPAGRRPAPPPTVCVCAVAPGSGPEGPAAPRMGSRVRRRPSGARSRRVSAGSKRGSPRRWARA